ncbi:hypothetical protein R5R73_05010 [Salinicola sp. LHM]|uniref:hypothetical protein n=1 Tax=Salinicola TaxID=404432 RepID=UPI0008DD7C05|nr:MULTISPECIES: hypothetical protein [Salinicola]MDF3918930.1 hypothetical protein [Salinicola salarius]MEC8916739.1 hypothetical protein [Pseudomonadota bacterium]OHZ01344.1 hypothetical protein BC443_13120 [Salinicola sp. MIT1003]WQH34049.1 hypothetical protein R5R73_05010 [Salinicola sp. LHM]
MARLVLNHLSDSTYRLLATEASKRNVNVSELAVVLLEIAVAELAARQPAVMTPPVREPREPE